MEQEILPSTSNLHTNFALTNAYLEYYGKN
jgi:hypothetical protein